MSPWVPACRLGKCATPKVHAIDFRLLSDPQSHIKQYWAHNPDRTRKMKLPIVVSLGPAIAVQAASQFATIIEGRDVTNKTSYDFVIAGGGIAGLTVADRLTEDPKGTRARSLLKIQPLKSYLSYSTCHRV